MSGEPSPLPSDVAALLAAEESILEQTLSSLDEQLASTENRFNRERTRARELTSTMIATQREEDRRQLASDEAVSHAMTTRYDENLESLRLLKEKPYFARVLLEEEEPDGTLRQIEYKIGQAANPTCRIIDWRRAPLSKLYYEYREGDEYCEQVLGKERIGRVALRNRLEIEHGELTQVACRHGNFVRTKGSWMNANGSGGSSRDFSSLPEILSLISPEQFAAITKDAGNMVLIQGVAGSGKTTVALHRLSWLLEKGNSDLVPANALILTLGPSLREYIRSSLRGLHITDLGVHSYRDWSAPLIAPHLPQSLLHGVAKIPALTGAASRAPSSIERVKRSMAMLRAMEQVAPTIDRNSSALELLRKTMVNPKLIVSLDETRLISAELVQAALRRTAEIEARGTLDRSDFSLILRAVQLLKGLTAAVRRNTLYEHIVVDEVQDYSPVELATVLSAVKEVGNVTLVGDTSQRVEEGFPGWEKLRKWWSGRTISSSFVKLEVSHRSTRPIAACAAAIAGTPSPEGGRSGPKPTWFSSASPSLITGAMIDWLKEGIDRSPNALFGVVCFSAKEVKELYSLLAPTFGTIVRIGDESGFSFDEGIIVCEAYAAKGLEFHGVLVYQPTSSNLPPGDVGQHLLYVASTRACDLLAFATCGRGASPLSKISTGVLNRQRLIEELDEAVNAEG